MTAREQVLRRIRDALEATPEVPVVPRSYRTVGHLAAPAIVDRFVERAGEYHATVHRIDLEGLAGTVARILNGAAVGGSIVVPAGLPAAWLDGLDERIEVLRDAGTLGHGRLATVDAVVTGAAVAIADTGTVVLDGSADQGRRVLSLLPDHHVCVVAAGTIVETVPEGLARVDPTRPLTLISGPSATSDIELDRVEGVHGPRRLDLVVVD